MTMLIVMVVVLYNHFCALYSDSYASAFTSNIVPTVLCFRRATGSFRESAFATMMGHSMAMMATPQTKTQT